MADHSTPSQYDSTSPGGLDTRLIILVGAISAVLFIVMLLAVEAWYYSHERRVAEENYRRGNPELQAYFDAQEQRLTRVNRIEGDPAHVTVPINWAIDRFVAKQGEKKGG